MTKRTIQAIAISTAMAGLMLGQQPKSQPEVEALQKIINATAPDARIKAVEELVTKFADTEFKGWALNAAGDAAQMMRDNPKAIVYYERALEAEPKNYNAMLMLAGVIAQGTREFDLDKEEKLSKAEKYAKEAMTLVASAVKPNPQVTDAQWEEAKKDFTAMAHQDLGLVAIARKKYDVAITEFKEAIDGAAGPDPSTMVRLAGAYSDAGKPDDAISVLDKVLAMADLNPSIKQVAQAEKARAEKAKAAKQ
jgi:tetratricopeptide (TPR) repeat protein